MFQELLSNRLHELLPIGQTIAGWLLKGIDLEWLKKEYRNMLELFKDSPAYQWMTEDAREEGREEERLKMKEERLKALESYRQIVITLVNERYPQLTERANRLLQKNNDQERLQRTILQVGLSKDAAEVANILAELQRREKAEE